MSHVLRVGVADQIAYFRAFNDDGSARADLTSATAGLSLSVFRIGLAAVSIASLSNKAADNTAHADGAIRHVGGNLYTIDLPDAAAATQTSSLGVRGSFTGGVIEPVPHPVVAYDPSLAAVGALTTLGGNAPANWINAAAIASNVVLQANLVQIVGNNEFVGQLNISLEEGLLAYNSADFVVYISEILATAIRTGIHGWPLAVNVIRDDLATSQQVTDAAQAVIDHGDGDGEWGAVGAGSGPGQGTATIEKQNEILVALANIGSIQITRIGPEYMPANRCITLIAGDDYLEAIGNALTFDIELPNVDLSTCTAAFAAAADYKGLLPGTATLLDVTTDAPKLRLEWTREQTSRTPDDNYSWAVRIINSDGLQQTILAGPLKLKRSPFAAT